jgi:PAS domain S-box-containing protein
MTVQRVLSYASQAGFLFLGLAALRAWLRSRDRSSGYFALALGLLAVTSLLGLVGQLLDYKYSIFLDGTVVALLASGYFLLLFRHSLIPFTRTVLWAAAAFLAAVAVATIASSLPYAENPKYTTSQGVILALVVGAWSACVAEPIYRFWRLSRNRPAVQRARLRSLSIAYAVLVFILVLAVGARPTNSSGLSIAIQVVALLLVPALFASFLPPVWLRRAWREKEEEELGLAEDLTVFAPDVQTLAERAIDWPIRLVGADAGFIWVPDREVLVAQGMDRATAERMKGRFGELSATEIVKTQEDTFAIAAPLRSDATVGLLVVLAGPLTPFFGDDEVERLGKYARAIAIAVDRVSLTEQLARQNALQETLVRALSDLDEGVVIWTDRRITYTNEAYCRLTGYSEAELKSLDPTKMTPKENQSRVSTQYEDRVAGRPVEERYESQLIRKDGTPVDIEVAIKLLPSRPVQLISIIRDITERKRVERALSESEQLFRQIFQAGPVGIATANEDFKFTRVNAAYCKLVGYGEEELLGQSFAVVTHPDDVDSDETLARRLFAGEIPSYQIEKRYLRKSGEMIWVSVSASVVRDDDGLVSYGIAIVEDVTARKEAEEEMQRVDAAKSEFIANAAHELRTPLTAIWGLSSTLAAKRKDLSEEQLEWSIQTIDRQGKRMGMLVRNLLDITQMDYGRLRIELRPLSIAGAVIESLDATPAPDGRRVVVDIPPELEVMADRERLDQALSNLLTNSYRYGGVNVTIDARSTGEYVELAITDDGPGVPEELLPHLFDPFARAMSSRTIQGSGLGLAIVRRIVEAMGGEVWYEPVDGSGARFCIRLKRSDKPAEVS